MSNSQLLSYSVVAAKKRAKREQIQQVVFDDDVRREFLTGFHKRKVAKADAAKKRAQEREKQERLKFRREQRQSLRERAQENAAQVERAYGAEIDSDDSEWSGISSHQAKGKQRQEDFEDDEILATVTVVEDFDADTILHGPRADAGQTGQTPSTETYKPYQQSPVQPSPPKPTLAQKSKPKKIKYETKAARSAARSKQRKRRTEKAELAGGKASRRRKHSGKRKG